MTKNHLTKHLGLTHLSNCIEVHWQPIVVKTSTFVKKMGKSAYNL